MKLGSIFGSMSPVFGLASGQGLFGSKPFQALAGSLSPLYGAASGNGAFGSLLQALLGGGQQQNPQQQAPVQQDPNAPAQPGENSLHNGMSGIPNIYLGLLLRNLMNGR
jgi:hypothetical protein